MTQEQLTETQINAINGMTDEVRYNHIVSQMRKNEVVWTLSDDRGCLVVDTGEEPCIVLFSHKELAELWAEGDYSDCKGLAIDLDAFLERWVPGMTKDGFFVALQPNLESESMVEAPEDFAENF